MSNKIKNPIRSFQAKPPPIKAKPKKELRRRIIMQTICELIADLRNYESVKENIGIQAKLDEIQCQAEKMENRLLEYCNAIENLGFERTGRDYTKQ